MKTSTFSIAWAASLSEFLQRFESQRACCSDLASGPRKVHLHCHSRTSDSLLDFSGLFVVDCARKRPYIAVSSSNLSALTALRSATCVLAAIIRMVCCLSSCGVLAQITAV